MPGFRVVEIVARVIPRTLVDRWSAEKRAMFLLDEEIATPLSVDDGIWPNTPDTDIERTVRIAILAELAMPAPGAIEPPIEAAAAAHWPLLGYDVADAWQVSGLTNCAYSPQEKASLTDIWRPRLTRSGLIQTEAWASAFVDIANVRVPEHAPFFVYEIRSADVDSMLTVRDERAK